MSAPIIGLHHWFDSPPGRYLLAWEQACFDEAVVDIFGYHSLQLGVPLLDGLRANRMPYRWLALGQEVAGGASAAAQTQAEGAAAPQRQQAALLAEPVALPFAAASLDLIVLPHTLELSIDPHAALREVERVLVPEGRVVISGMNPTSLWGLRQRRARWYRHLGHGTPYLPEVGELIGYWRLRDWLRLLGFEVESTRFGCYRPAVRSAQWLERFGWMDALGEKWWPILGAAYFLVAVKRVHGMRLLNPAWRSSRQRAATTVPLANSTNSSKNGRGPRRHLDGQEPLASCPCGAGAASDPGGMRTMAVMNHRHGNTA
ncbi:class I SAM-dependent methyltransferase [Verminephrobacter eiseniae]|uniref:class I SAM-dependent methyltransferase n=1 Tax=Verminephrobacter eiseniae TaxID=364317 RepID=UPI0022374C3C|nr:methyltransferase domain-containing protein [Verminephrobacter eiseniae]